MPLALEAKVRVLTIVRRNFREIFYSMLSSFFLYICDWGCSISKESWSKIEMIQYQFITYNLKIKGNTPYPVLLIELGLSPIESITMLRYLMYKKKLDNME